MCFCLQCTEIIFRKLLAESGICRRQAAYTSLVSNVITTLDVVHCSLTFHPGCLWLWDTTQSKKSLLKCLVITISTHTAQQSPVQSLPAPFFFEQPLHFLGFCSVFQSERHLVITNTIQQVSKHFSLFHQSKPTWTALQHCYLRH